MLSTSSFVRDECILLSDKLIFTLLAQMHKSKFWKKYQYFFPQVVLHPGKWSLESLAWMDKFNLVDVKLLNVHKYVDRKGSAAMLTSI